MVTAEDIAVVSVQEPKKEEEAEEVFEEGEEPSEESTDGEQVKKAQQIQAKAKHHQMIMQNQMRKLKNNVSFYRPR